MKLLLDTQIWIWWFGQAEKVPKKVAVQLEDPSNEIFFSSASSLEISIKVRIGKLKLPEEATSYVTSRIALAGMTGLSITHEHALGVGVLPPIHEDPFDRILVSQAIIEKLHFVTADKVLAKYPVDIVRAW